MQHSNALSFYQGLGALAQQLEAPASECHNLALAIFVVFVVRLDVAVCDLGDHLNHLGGLANQLNQAIVFGLEELQQRPDRDMLESGVAACEETPEVAVYAARGLCPVLNEDAVITHYDN
jgi:hypothetical protein